MIGRILNYLFLNDIMTTKVRFPIATLSRSEAKKLKKVRETKQRRVAKRILQDELEKRS